MNRFLRLFFISCAALLSFSPAYAIAGAHLYAIDSSDQLALAKDVMNAFSVLEQLKQRTQRLQEQGMESEMADTALKNLSKIRSEVLQQALIDVLSITEFATKQDLFDRISKARTALTLFEQKMKLSLSQKPEQTTQQALSPSVAPSVAPVDTKEPKKPIEVLPVESTEKPVKDEAIGSLALEEVPLSDEPTSEKKTEALSDTLKASDDDLMKALDTPAASESTELTRDLSALPLDD